MSTSAERSRSRTVRRNVRWQTKENDVTEAPNWTDPVTELVAANK